MADTQSNIQVNIDTTQALASIKNLQRQISAFHSSMAKGGAAANAVSAQMQQTLINSINATGKFSAQIRTIRTTTESFTDSLEKNKFSLGEYFRYAGGASKTFGRLFKTEFATINKVARENVKDLQTQYISLGRDASGAMKSIAVRPLALDMTDLATRTQVAAQKQAILNQLLKQGSTNLLNFGKNTQWAGRQLMVGFTLPLIAVGSAAAKTFMDMETQAIRFKKVYGDLFTPNAESAQALKDIEELGKEFTKYGIAVSSTVGLAAEAAAAGFKGVDLTRQTTAATRLSILGQVESQKALETTIALQNAFSMSSENLAESIDFLNAVENQTVLSLDDVSTAIPKAAPIIQQLGGDVKDLAFFMTAMKEGGINASEGANAIKSGLASMINPTGKASAMLESFGINVKKIVVDNKGDLKKTVVEFATALNMLDPLNRAQAIEQMFGKFQFARLSTLFANVTKEGTQASRVLDLAGSSVQDLAALSEKELGMTSESAMNKFKGAVESLKLSLIPLGEQFLKAVTPIAEFITRVLDKFNNFSDTTKKIIVVITGIVAGLGPVLLMTAGLVMNGLANMIKLFAFLKSAFNKTGQSTATLGTEVQYMTTEQRNAAAVAASLDQVHTKLAQTFTSEASAVNALTRAYQRAIAAQSQFVPVGPPITRGPIKKFAGGRPSTVGGTGNKDSELALLMPGETVIPTKMSQKYGSLINAMISDTVPGYGFGKTKKGATQVPIYPENAIRLQPAAENMAGRAGTTTVPQVLSPLALRIGEARGIAPTLSKVDSGAFDQIYREYKKITTEFVKRVNLEYNTTFKDIKDENERMRKSWAAAGKAVEKQVDSIASPKDRAVVRKAFALDEDDYATIPTDSREAGGTAPNRSRRGAFRSRLTGLRSYTRIRPGAKRLYERMTKKSAADLQMGHVFPPRAVDLATLEADPRKSGSVATARAVTERGKKDAESYEAGKKKGKIKDPYETSTESTRKSPHPQAAKDGRDDARAYATARDKELRRQSGRSRRVATRPEGEPGAPAVVPVAKKTPRKPGPATRPQGPAPIGATPQPGMTILPIVPADPKDPPKPKAKPKAKPKGIQRLASKGGGMGILGANMALSMVPDFAGKSIAQGALAGASLGMMFGKYGPAAGAAIGLVTVAVAALIEKQKQHKAMMDAMFKSSTALATLFGNAVINTEMAVGTLSSSLGITGTETKKLGESFGYTNSELKAFIDLVASLPENDPLKELVTGLKNENDPKEIERIAKAFVTTQIAIGQIKPEQAQKSLDLLLASTENSDMVGTVFMTIKTQVEAVSLTLRATKDNTIALGQSLTDLSGAASNATSLEQMKIIIDGIAASGISAAAALSSMYYAYLSMGNLGAADTVQVLEKISGITAAQSQLIFQATQKGFRFTADFKTDPKQLAKQAEEFLRNKKLFETETPGSETLGYQSEQTKTLNKQIDVLKKKKKIIDDQIKKEKEITDELKKQNDYLDKQRSLDKEIVDAKIRGEYIQAASLLQEKTQLTSEFNKDKDLSILQGRSDALQARIDALQESSDKVVSAVNATTGAVLASGQQITDAVNNQKPGEQGGGEFVGPDGSSKRNAFPLKITPENIQSYIDKYDPKGEYVAGAKGSGGNAKISASDLDPKRAWKDNASKDALEEYIRRVLASKISQLVNPEDGIVISLEGSDKKLYKFKVQKNGEFIRMGTPETQMRKASGGVIRGAGTGTSDSIPALLSNGEYVIKAKSVKKYGVGALDALNAGRFATGGLIKGYDNGGLATSPYGPYVPTFPAPTQNWFQKYVSKLTKSQEDAGNMLPSFMRMNGKADALGAGSILRQLTGQGQAGDKFTAALFPLNFLGMGSAKGALQKPVSDAAATTPSILAAAGRAVKLAPSGAVELFKTGLWNMLGGIKSVRPHLSKVIGMQPFGRSPIEDFKSAYKFVKMTKKTYFDGVINKPKGPKSTPKGAPEVSDDFFHSYVPKLTPFEALGDLSALLHNKFILPITPPIKSGVSKIKSTFSKENLASQALKLSPRSISNFLYRYTPVGSIQALRLAKERGMQKTIADIGPGLDLSVPEVLQQALYHGGRLPEEIANRLTPFSDKVLNGNIFNFDLFTTVEKLMAREYAVGKNAEAGGGIWKMLLDAPKSMSKIWDMRGGAPSLWSQNKSGYAAIEQYFIDVLKVPVQEARAMLAGERVPGVARLSKDLMDRMHLFHPENLNKAFSTVGKNGPEWIIDSIVHTGGKLTNSDILHAVFTTLDPEKYVASFANVLPKEELVKTFGTFEDFLPSELERFIEQYAKYGKTFGSLLQGTWPVKHKSVTSVATGGYLNNGKVKLPKFAEGGTVFGAGTATSDSIPAMLSNGEYVVQAKSVKKYGVGTLDALNAGRFATGGQVGRSASSYIPRLNDGGIIPAFGGGGIVGKLLGGIGKAISKLFVGKSMGKPIKPNEVETFLSDTLGGATLPKIKKQELPAGVGGQYIPRFSDPASNYENLLPHILLNSKYKVQGNTAIHETMHHFDMDVMHDSFRRTIAKLRKDGKTDLADEYESLFVTAENKQKGMGLAVWEDRAITLQDYDSLTYFGGAAEAFADENTFKAYTKFMSSPKIKDKKLALKIGNPYGPGFSTDRLRGYFKTYSQFEHNALNMPMRLNPSFLRGLVENSPNMPQKTRDVYLAWAEGLERFKPPVRSNPDEIRNSLQFQNFRKYITDNKLDKAEGFHAGGPVGHRHGRSLPPTNPVINPYWEQYDPRTKQPFKFPAPGETVHFMEDMLPPSMRPQKSLFGQFKRLFTPSIWGIGKDVRGKEVTGGVVDLPYNTGKFVYDNLIFPGAMMAERMLDIRISETNKKRDAELQKRSDEEGFMSVLPSILGQTVSDASWFFPYSKAGTALGNIGISESTIARLASEKAAEKAAKRLALEQAGIGFRGTLNRLADNPFLSKTLPSISSFKPKHKAIKQKQKSGEELSDVERRLFDATQQAAAGNFTPIEKLGSASHATLLKELKALNPETGYTPDGQFVYKFTPARADDFPSPEALAAGIKAMKDNPLDWSVSEFPGPPHRLEFFIPGKELTDAPIAKLQWNSVTGSIGGMNIYKESLKGKGIAKFANLFAATRTRLQHSRNRTDQGIAYSTRPSVTGLLPGYNIADEVPLLRAWADRLGIKPIEPYVPPTPKSTYEEVFDQQRGFTPDANGLLPSGYSLNPNPMTFGDNSVEANARREALMAQTRARMVDSMSDAELDAARRLWRANPNRTHDTYPFVNGSIYDWEDNYDLTALMKLGVSKPAGVPWRSNDAQPHTPSVERRTSDEYDGIRGATGGFLNKGKLRVPKFANGGLIKGPGTGISDSIQAGFGYAGGGSIRVSNGEYVVKASSVRDYGVKTMDAINNGTARVGTDAGGTVYNINMPITSNNANPEIVANEVMRKLKLEVSKNNKTNRVGG